jgi:hypothetical protein
VPANDCSDAASQRGDVDKPAAATTRQGDDDADDARDHGRHRQAVGTFLSAAAFANIEIVLIVIAPAAFAARFVVVIVVVIIVIAPAAFAARFVVVIVVLVPRLGPA